MIDWSHWHNEPLLIGTLVLVAWAYALAVGPWRFRFAPAGTGAPRKEIARFSVALVIFYLAVGSPLDQIGERFLLSAHMVQHLFITNLVAPLVLAGSPWWLVDAVVGRRGVRPIARVLLNPVVAGITFVLCLSFWHVPAAYDHALRVKTVHVVQHLMFFAAALLGWWPFFSRSRVFPRLSPGAQVLYVFALGVLQMPLGAFLTFSREVLYPTYAFAPRLLDMTPLQDQILGGVVMTGGGMLMALGLMSWSFYCWNRESNSGEIPRGLSHRT